MVIRWAWGSESRQQEFWVATVALADASRYVLYARLNAPLAESGFDRFVESICEMCYNECRRPSIPPGAYFRMLLVGYFEDSSSPRVIAWRCSDSPL